MFLTGIAVSPRTGAAGHGTDEASIAGAIDAGFSTGAYAGAAGWNDLPTKVRAAAIPTRARSSTSRTRSDRLDDSVDGARTIFIV